MKPVEYDESEKFVFGPITLSVGLLGLLCNISAVFRLSRLYSYSPCFALYCVAHLMADSLVLILFLTYVTPRILVPEIWSDTIVHFEKPIGYIGLTLQYCSFYTTMMITLNRAYVVVFPFKKTAFIEGRFAICATIAVWLYAAVSSIIFLMPGCSFTFHPRDFCWKWEDSACGETLGWYIDIVYNCSFFAVLIVIDILTVAYAHYRSKRWCDGMASVENSRKRKQEIGFFIQACVVSAGFVCMLCSFYVLSLVDIGNVGSFMTALIWELSHCVQGIVIIIFNRNQQRRSIAGKNITVKGSGTSVILGNNRK